MRANERARGLTGHLVAVVESVDVYFGDVVLEAHRLHKVVDLVEAELVVLLEEDEAVENAQVGVRVEVPDVLQVMIVEHDKRVAATASAQPDDVPC